MEKQDKKDLVHIHIDKKLYESPDPTTGDALYLLANASADLELYRDKHGKRDDEPIERGPQMVDLKEGEHFTTDKPRVYTIIVNGQKKTWPNKHISFGEVVKLAFPTPPTGQNILYSVTYEEGPPPNPQGSMVEGDRVKIKDGMVFNVTATDRS